MDKRSTFRARFGAAAEAFMICAAVALPWSVSIAVLMIVLWLLSALIALSPRDIGEQIATPSGGLSVALCLLIVISMFWASVSWAERASGADAYLKLLTVPILLAQFSRTENGHRILYGFLASCTVLLVLSWTFIAWPGAAFLSTRDLGVPVRSAATQSSAFVICAFMLLYLAIDGFRRGNAIATAATTALALLFLANVFSVLTAMPGWFMVPRLSLFIAPILLAVLAQKEFGAKGALIAIAAMLAAGAAALLLSPSLQAVASEAWQRGMSRPEIWIGDDRPVFWQKSLEFIREAPIVGHGAGSMGELFSQAAVGQAGVAARVTLNPHQQTFAVGIQCGLIGIVLLWAMWIAHLFLFRGGGLAAWIGLVVVLQNILGSIFDSQLVDFAPGWTYALFVGVAGGMVHNPAVRDVDAPSN